MIAADKKQRFGFDSVRHSQPTTPAKRKVDPEAIQGMPSLASLRP